MIEGHINRAKHNENFVKDCEVQLPGQYLDWKTTANFYCALHLFRAFLKKKEFKEEIESHDQLVALFNTKRNGGRPPFQIKQHVWQAYCDLRKISEAARYSLLYNEELELAMQADEFVTSSLKLAQLKQYFSQFGISTDTEAAA